MSPSQTVPSLTGFSSTVDCVVISKTTHQDATGSAGPQLVDEYPALLGQLQSPMMSRAKTPEDYDCKVPFITTPHFMKPDADQHTDTEGIDCEEKPAEKPHMSSLCAKESPDLDYLKEHMVNKEESSSSSLVEEPQSMAIV